MLSLKFTSTLMFAFIVIIIELILSFYCEAMLSSYLNKMSLKSFYKMLDILKNMSKTVINTNIKYVKLKQN